MKCKICKRPAKELVSSLNMFQKDYWLCTHHYLELGVDRHMKLRLGLAAILIIILVLYGM